MKLIYKILIIIGIVILVLGIAVGIFAYRNLNYDYIWNKSSMRNILMRMIC